jgi:uncharacterized protein
MKILSRISSAAGLALSVVLALALGSAPAGAQTAPAAPPTAAAIAAAKEILLMKNADGMFTSIVPNVVEKTKAALVQSNLNYQKDLGEVALIVAKNLAGRQSEIIGGMAQVYALQFTEQELKDLVVFYKTPLGQKVLTAEPRAIQASMSFVNQWAQQFSAVANEQFRAEMHKRGKDI